MDRQGRRRIKIKLKNQAQKDVKTLILCTKIIYMQSEQRLKNSHANISNLYLLDDRSWRRQRSEFGCHALDLKAFVAQCDYYYYYYYYY